tara:strand:+ start:17192 stop:18763 length:1572 start_codon:yes stop_codon:yes gene_type:complete
MSDKITYILEVLDKYSVNTKKFKTEMLGVKRAAESLDVTLLKTQNKFKTLTAASGISKSIRETNALTSSLERMGRVTQRNAVQAASYSRSLGNTRKTFAGPYTPIRFNPQAGKYEDASPQSRQPVSGGGGGSGVSFGGVAKAMGYYAVIDKVIGTPRAIHDITVEMDSLRAGLSALIPNVKGLEDATSASEISYLRGVADKYGMKFSDIAPSYLKILGTGGNIDSSLAKGLIEKVGGYGGLLGLSSPALSDTLRGFQDMLTKQVLNAQEVNLQMQQLPGVKPMLHKAFLRVAQRSGIKDVNEQNSSQMFSKYMATGKLKSAPILKELILVMDEMFGAQMLEKAHKLGNEERRLSNAFQELGTSIGDLTYPAQIGGVRALTSLTQGINKFIEDVNLIADHLPKGEDSESSKVLKRTGNIMGTTYLDYLKSPFTAAKYAGSAVAASFVGEQGDFSSWAKDELKNKDFQGINMLLQDISTIVGFLKDQKVIIEFTGNVPQNITTTRVPQNISVRNGSTLSPAGGVY